MFSFEQNNILKFIILICFFTLSSAYFVEFIMGHLPCALCKIQRIPYIAGIILISLYFILNSRYKIILTVLTLLFIFGTIVSLYHVGIEQGFFKESFLCQLKDGMDADTPSELLSQLKMSNISCKDVPFTFFGLSLATLNTLLSFLISVILLRLLKSYEKNK